MKVQNEANMKYVILSTGLVVDMDKVIGVQPNPDNENEFFIHTITSQYYKVSKEDYKYLPEIPQLQELLPGQIYCCFLQ